MNEIESKENYCQNTIALKNTIESGFIVLGERLYVIKLGQLWDSQWTSFAEYLMEMNINESTASKLISVHRIFVEKFNINEKLLIETNWSKLYEVIPLINDESTTQSVENIIKQVGMLKREDSRLFIKEQLNGICHHEWSEIHLRTCALCSKRERINGQSYS